eukprot:870607-Prorocentrum_minimum.AAC.1
MSAFNKKNTESVNFWLFFPPEKNADFFGRDPVLSRPVSQVAPVAGSDVNFPLLEPGRGEALAMSRYCFPWDHGPALQSTLAQKVFGPYPGANGNPRYAPQELSAALYDVSEGSFEGGARGGVPLHEPNFWWSERVKDLGLAPAPATLGMAEGRRAEWVGRGAPLREYLRKVVAQAAEGREW